MVVNTMAGRADITCDGLEVRTLVRWLLNLGSPKVSKHDHALLVHQ